MIRHGKRQLPVGAGCSTRDELGFVLPQEGGGDQNLAPPHRYMLDNTESHYLSRLLVVEVTVNGFADSHTTVIASGSSSNYDRRRCLEGSQPYAEVMKAQDSETITIHLATETCVTFPELFIILA